MDDRVAAIIKQAEADRATPGMGLDLLPSWREGNVLPDLLGELFSFRQKMKSFCLKSRRDRPDIEVANSLSVEIPPILERHGVKVSEFGLAVAATILNYALLPLLRPEISCAIEIEEVFLKEGLLKGLERVNEECIDSPGAIQLSWTIIDTAIVERGDVVKFQEKIEKILKGFHSLSPEARFIGLNGSEVSEIHGGEMVVLLHRREVKSARLLEVVTKDGYFRSEVSGIRTNRPDGVFLPWGVGTGMKLEFLCLDSNMGGSSLIMAASGSGKSVLVQSVAIVAYAAGYGPRDLQIIAIDGGNKTTLRQLQNLPYSYYKGKSFRASDQPSDLEEVIALMDQIDLELKTRQKKVDSVNAGDWVNYNRNAAPGDRIPALLVIFDEFSTTRNSLSSRGKDDDDPIYKDSLSRIDRTLSSVCNQGRSAGVFFMGICPQPDKQGIGNLASAVSNLIYGHFPPNTVKNFKIPSEIALIPPRTFLSTQEGKNKIFYSFNPGNVFSQDKWEKMLAMIGQTMDETGTLYDRIVTRAWKKDNKIALVATPPISIMEDSDPWDTVETFSRRAG